MYVIFVDLWHGILLISFLVLCKYLCLVLILHVSSKRHHPNNVCVLKMWVHLLIGPSSNLLISLQGFIRCFRKTMTHERHKSLINQKDKICRNQEVIKDRLGECQVRSLTKELSRKEFSSQTSGFSMSPAHWKTSVHSGWSRDSQFFLSSLSRCPLCWLSFRLT